MGIVMGDVAPTASRSSPLLLLTVSLLPAQVRKSFEELDKDGDGFISPEDLVKVMPRGSSIELAREMVKEVDKDNDGKVNYNEVRGLCTFTCRVSTGSELPPDSCSGGMRLTPGPLLTFLLRSSAR